MFDFEGLSALPPDLAAATPAYASEARSSSSSSSSSYGDAATAPAAGRDGDVDLAEGPEFVGFDAVADRTSVCRARRGAFQGAIHEFDASDHFWNLRRWVLRPAVLAYSYAPNRDGAPAAIVDLGAGKG